jgi:hypothetical protein
MVFRPRAKAVTPDGTVVDVPVDDAVPATAKAPVPANDEGEATRHAAE